MKESSTRIIRSEDNSKVLSTTRKAVNSLLFFPRKPKLSINMSNSKEMLSVLVSGLHFMRLMSRNIWVVVVKI
jgi:hypothetical protein